MLQLSLRPDVNPEACTTKQDFVDRELSSGLTLGFQYYEDGSLFPKFHRRLNLWCKANLLQSRLCCCYLFSAQFVT